MSGTNARRPATRVWRNWGAERSPKFSAPTRRIRKDSDPNAESYSEYSERGEGNGRRLVGVLMNKGHPSYTVIQIGCFFLLPASECDAGGNSPFCAEYVRFPVLTPLIAGSGRAAPITASLPFEARR